MFTSTDFFSYDYKNFLNKTSPKDDPFVAATSDVLNFSSKVATFFGSILFFLKNSTQFSFNFLSLILGDPVAKSVFVLVALLLFYLYLGMPFFNAFFERKLKIKFALFSFLLSFAGIGFLASKVNKITKADTIKSTTLFEKITKKIQ